MLFADCTESDEGEWGTESREGVITTEEIAAMNFQNLTLAILLAAYYTRSLDNLYQPDRYADRRRAALVAGARAIWYDGFRAGLEHATSKSG